MDIQITQKFSFQSTWHSLFRGAIYIKAFNGVWEIVLGVIILFARKSTLERIFARFSRAEILEHPHDRLFDYFSHAFQNFSTNTQVFAGIYILAHGLLNIFLAVQLLRNRLWAYLVTVAIMLLFMIYQSIRIVQHDSTFLMVVTIFDALFIVLTMREYFYRKKLENG